MPNNPVTAAQNLTASLDEFTTALNSVRHRYRIIAALVVFTLVLTFAAIKTRYDSRVDSCAQDNQLRSGLLHVADRIEANDVTPTPESIAFIEGLREDFALRNCGDIPWL